MNNAAPSAPPASPAAGWIQTCSKGPSRRIRPFATQLSASADHTIGPGDYSNTEITAMGGWGGWDDYQTVYATGSIQLSGNNTGGGVLVIDGDFTLTGSFLPLAALIS